MLSFDDSGVRILLSNLAMLGDSQGGVRQFWRPWKKKGRKKEKKEKKEKEKKKSRNYILLNNYSVAFILSLMRQKDRDTRKIVNFSYLV